MSSSSEQFSVAVGPAMPGWGSWEWVGQSLIDGFGAFAPIVFEPWDVPDADVVLIVKHRPPEGWMEQVCRRSCVVYCPVDRYSAPDEIEAEGMWLGLCSRIVVHSQRLGPYFAPFARTEYIDHPLKFTIPTRQSFRQDGPILWVGVRSNLPPLIDWVNAHPLELPLEILTNLERPSDIHSPAAFGFRKDRDVRIHEWSPDRHRLFTAQARVALDIKGDDFRSRHKPPAKALDFIASGLPVALSAGSGPSEHLARLGLVVPTPHETERWLSESYWDETRRLGERVTKDLSLIHITRRFRGIIDSMLSERRSFGTQASARGLEVQSSTAHADMRKRDVAPESEAKSEIDDRRWQAYLAARELATQGRVEEARIALVAIDSDEANTRLRALTRNDLAALAAARGLLDSARTGFASALELDPECHPARENLAVLDGAVKNTARPPLFVAAKEKRTRIAILSLLFNWPTT